MRLEWIVAGAMLATGATWAQQAPDFLPGQMGRSALVDPAEWKELEVPPPPPLRTDALVPVDAGAAALRFGIDPASVGVGTDRVVRYVIVAQSASGALNAMYEGILCERDEYRVYARYAPGEGWRASESEWKSVKEGVEANHVRAVARNGACLGHSPSGTAQQVVQNLRSRADTRFGAGRY